MAGEESLRLDRWLWFARFFKTRSLASRACAAGAVRIDGRAVAKANAAVRPGQVLTFVQGRHVRVIRVVALGSRRGPAPEAQALYEDLSPPVRETLLPRDEPAARAPGAGRPTKRERRAIDRLQGRDPGRDSQ
ncbi:MAG: RNA-binding S4 domain-containing protein [Azospirillaceae bacterium]